MTPLRGLYPIVDLTTLEKLGLEPLTVAQAMLTARPPLLQLRAKEHAPRLVLELLTHLKPLCERARTLLIVNDRPDLALLAEAHGVHVGQDDLPLSAVRRLPGALQVGVSTHNLMQLEAALEQKPDYVAFGPIFPTHSKLRADPALGLDAVAAAAELARGAGVPLVVIGGLTLEVAPQLARHDLCAAVISDLLAAGTAPAQIATRARHWQEAFGGG